MPKRPRTREQDQLRGIEAERAANHIENAAYDAEMAKVLGPLTPKPRPEPEPEPDDDGEPPPF